jgi:hypothetical protein
MVFMPVVELLVRLVALPSVSVLLPESVAAVVPKNESRATLRSAVSSGWTVTVPNVAMLDVVLSAGAEPPTQFAPVENVEPTFAHDTAVWA